MFQIGSIRRIQVSNFVTYSHAEFYPGPNLNMIIGPNGTGKSTMVAAIILGLGGNPKVVGRGTRVSEYVKHGCSDAKIDIFLQEKQENDFLKISRHFDKQERSNWFINNVKKNLHEVVEALKPFNIQVNNLCQFLPQDKVQDFAKMNKQELLKATQQAVGREDLIEKQNNLLENKKLYTELDKSIGISDQKLSEAKEINARLEGKVRNFNMKKKYQESIQHIKRKTAWRQYEEIRSNLTEVKEDKIKAQEVFEKHRNAAKPMELKLNKSKKNIHELQVVQSNITKNIREIEKTLRDECDRQDDFKQSILRTQQEMNVQLDEFDERDKEIDACRRKIEELKETQKKMLDKCGNDQQILQKVRQISSEIEQMMLSKRHLENKKDELVSSKQNMKSELRMLENEITRLENIKHQRLQKLQQVDRHAYEGVLWLRNNKHLFKGEVCEPMLLEINVLDKNNAIFLENVISKRDRLAFTCERKDDMSLLIQSLRKQQKLSINVLYSNAEIDMDKYQPNIPIEHLRNFGFYAYLHSLFTAPKLIMNYLLRTYGIQNIPVGTKKVDESFEQVPNQIVVFFSDKCRYAVRFSKYTGAKSTRQNQIVPNNTLSISLDVVKLENLRSKKQEQQNSFAGIDNQLKNYDEQLQQSSERIQEMQSELKVIRDLKQQYQAIGSRYTSMQKKLETLKSANSDKDTVKREADAKIEKIIKNMVNHQRQIHDTFKTYNKLIVKSRLNCEKVELSRRQAAYLQNEINETKRQYQEAEELLNEVKAKHADILGQAKSALQKAKDISNGCTPDDPGFNQFRPIYDELPDDLRSLQAEKEQLISKIDCLRTADNGEMEEYEKRIGFIKGLETDIEKATSELNRIKVRIETLQNDWLLPLSNLVTDINRNFSNAFKRMDCAGEVSISTGDDQGDFSQYGLSIKVSYRHGEPLQELNSTVQSGGERAVATAAFMLSLQELTPVPFRCVDEINQGMDANNERRIFDILIDCTTQGNSPQYFMITPKLVPCLRFSTNMMVHFVHNGPFVVPDRKWYASKLCNSQNVKMVH